MHASKITFSEFGQTGKIISDAGTYFTSETYKDFCKKLNIQQSTTSSHYHQSNVQIEICIKFVKYTIKKRMNTNQDISLSLLQIFSSSLGAGLLSPVTILFSRPI